MTDVLSPELALVDPDAAELARRALPEVALFEDTLRPAPSEYAELRRLFEEPEEPAELEPVRRRGRVLRLAALALAVVVAAAAAVFYFAPDVRTQVAGALPDSAPAWLKPSKQAAVAPTRTAASAPVPAVPVSKPATPARTIPDFVWVAAPGAAGYRVEFRRGARVVYSTTTKEARLHVAAARLPPGKYRWQVRGLDRGGRAAGAPLVDAAVSVG